MIRISYSFVGRINAGFRLIDSLDCNTFRLFFTTRNHLTPRANGRNGTPNTQGAAKTPTTHVAINTKSKRNPERTQHSKERTVCVSNDPFESLTGLAKGLGLAIITQRRKYTKPKRRLITRIISMGVGSNGGHGPGGEPQSTLNPPSPFPSPPTPPLAGWGETA